MEENIAYNIETALRLMGFESVRITKDDTYRKISILIDDEMVQTHIPKLLPSVEHVVNLMLRKGGLPPYVIDVNHYRKERERLIIELARAAAHKAVITKTNIELPPMNAYERRIVHVEISVRPDLHTESLGEGKERRVLIKPIL